MANAKINAKILVVDDEPAIRSLIHRFLLKQDYQMESAEDGKTALQAFERFKPDLVILDVNLPDTTGYQLCQQMQTGTGVGVLMLTSRSDEADKIKGFSVGADDYLTKPFSLVELGARIEALLKRIIKPPLIRDPLCFGNLTIDPVRREVKLDSDLVSLTALEFNLLYFLASHPSQVVSRSELLQKVWNYDYVGDQRVVDVHIGQIRRKIEGNATQPTRIHTVRGVGYKFDPTPPTDTAS